jgi:hypothetical protein
MMPFVTHTRDIHVFEAIKAGDRPFRPANAPDDIWSIMERCWSSKVEERSSALDVLRLELTTDCHLHMLQGGVLRHLNRFDLAFDGKFGLTYSRACVYRIAPVSDKWRMALSRFQKGRPFNRSILDLHPATLSGWQLFFQYWLVSVPDSTTLGEAVELVTKEYQIPASGAIPLLEEESDQPAPKKTRVEIEEEREVVGLLTPFGDDSESDWY